MGLAVPEAEKPAGGRRGIGGWLARRTVENESGFAAAGTRAFLGGMLGRTVRALRLAGATLGRYDLQVKKWAREE